MLVSARYQATGGNFDCSRLRRQNSNTRSLAAMVLRLSRRLAACSASFNACTADNHKCFSLRAAATASRARCNASTAASLSTAGGSAFRVGVCGAGSGVFSGGNHIAHALKLSDANSRQKRRTNNSKAHFVQNLSQQTSICFDKLAGFRIIVNELHAKNTSLLGDRERARIMPLLSESET